MADTMNKPKLQLRTSFGITVGEKSPSPSPATKLLISHGKPNFTIQKNGNSPSPPIDNVNNNGNNVNNNYYPYKTAETVTTKTTINNNTVLATKAKFVEPQQENEATKVVLRKTPKVPEPPLKDGEDENVPEFIRRQRRIQERLAKEKVLDFENRRSGYFTHVMISPTSPNRTSFVETMASPAIVPSLEIPPPSLKEESEEAERAAEQQNGHLEETNGHSNGHHEESRAVASNGHVSKEEAEAEEVAQAIEEVNKAVAGEEDEKPTTEAHHEQPATLEEAITVTAVPAAVVHEEEPGHLESEHQEVEHQEKVHEETGHPEQEHQETKASVEHHEVLHTESKQEEVIEAKVAVSTLDLIETHEEVKHEESSLQEIVHINGDVKENEPLTNGNNDESVTISHTNALHDGPHIPTPDPSGALGVNYEPKTVVSFSKDLGSEINKYPDTVKVVKDDESSTPIDRDLQEMTKLKFDIQTNENEVHITPVLKEESEQKLI